jgi:hypothetical protein
MSILVTCTSCQAKLKAPEHGVGRRIKCLQCGKSLVVPAPPPAVKDRPRAPILLDDDSAPTDRTWVFAAGAAGACLVLVLGAVLAIKLIFTEPTVVPPPPHGAGPPPAEEKTPSVEPEAKPPEPEPKSPPNKLRAEQMAEIDARFKADLAAVDEKLAKHKTTLERLRKAEDALFRTPKANQPLLKGAPPYKNFIKDLAELMPGIVKDLVAGERLRDLIDQARRKVIFEHPQPGDPKYEDYVGLYLTQSEIQDLGASGLSGGSPRTPATRHVEAAQKYGTLKVPRFASVHPAPDDKDIAAAAFNVDVYLGKTGANIQAHVYVHRIRGAWNVVEFPGRNTSVIHGPPPAEWRRVD